MQLPTVQPGARTPLGAEELITNGVVCDTNQRLPSLNVREAYGEFGQAPSEIRCPVDGIHQPV